MSASEETPTTENGTNNKSSGEKQDGNKPTFSKYMTSSGLELYGVKILHLPGKDNPLEQVRSMRALTMREDDVLVAAYPKCGTHWVWEVVSMLVNKSTKYETRTKEFTMLEYSEMADIEKENSPRILNSHFHMCHLPKDIVPKKVKIIHVVRNPKDVFVSRYYHFKQLPGASFSMDDLLHHTINVNPYSQFKYMRQMSEFQKAHPDHPVKLVYFEDMKKDPTKVIKELAEFLQVPATDSFYEEVAVACSFKNMQAIESSREQPKVLQKLREDSGRPPVKLYRKGEVGDWKNNLTVAQNELLDAFIEKEMSNEVLYNFTYE